MKKLNQKLKKSKSNYFYSDNENEILGKTDNPCRTMINLFTVFRNNHNREVFFDIDNPKKIIIDKRNSLLYMEKDNKKVYKYKQNVITRNDFIILLGCEEK
ncbi:MAG: hypothetical protein Tp172MES766071_24 [Prokaryotic dsDNA virus sp.]|nr:MAG: hypothetical protein Tp172MES766071_24 [Prokaryotic dsDNA virus sp.]